MKILIPVIIGGVIGFFTNWLAIRMLFRPYEEKFIFGMKIPFTPGLIPKEQERIALNIGRTVEDYLLSPEAIVKFVDEDSIRIKVKTEIDRLLKGLEGKKVRIKDLLSKNIGINYSDFRVSFEKKIENYALKELRSKSLMSSLEAFLEDKINTRKLDGKLIEFIDGRIEDFLSYDSLYKIVNSFLDGQGKDMLEDGRRLEELIPDSLKEEFFKYLDENKRVIGYRVRNFVSSPPTEKKLKIAISNMVENNVSRLITAFVPMETISEKVYQALENYIKSDDANEDINIILKSIINDLLDKKVSELASDILTNIDVINIDDYIISFIQGRINREDIITCLEDRMLGMDRQPIIDLLVKSSKDFLNSKELEYIINGIIISSLDRIENIELINIFKALKLDSEEIYMFLERIFETGIRDRLPEIIDSLNIGNIVEGTIKEFEYDFVEKLILDIADKELKAITYLGGLLGGIIGLLTPLLQMI